MNRTVTLRTVDLNIFHREEWDDATRNVYLSDNLFIDVYDYWQFRYPNGDTGSDHAELGLLIECTPDETALIRSSFPLDEYGTDWFTFLDETPLPTGLRRYIDKKLQDITIPVVR